MNDKLYLWHVDKHRSLLKVDVIIWLCVTRHAQSTQNKFAYLCNISRKKEWDVKLIFCLQINTKLFCKLIVSLWVCIARNDEDDLLDSGEHENLLQIDTMILLGMVKHFQGSRNSKFAMSLQYLKNEVRDEVDFLHADKRQSGIQVDFNILGTKFS